MKVALVSSVILPTPPRSYGGLERVVADLARCLCDLGHEVTLYAAKGSRPDARVNLAEIRSESEALTDDLLAADAVHWHGWDAAALWRFAAAHADRRFVQTFHGPSLGWNAPPPNVTVCGVSHWHAWSLGCALGAECVGVPNGIHLDDYPLYEGPREPYLLSVNRLDPAKGIDRAIAAAKSAHMALRIAGPEHGVPDEGYVRAILARCDGEQVIWEGNLELEDKVHLMQRATAVLALGDWPEPFGLFAVEANACGTLVRASSRGALPEVLIGEGRTGGFVMDETEGSSPWESAIQFVQSFEQIAGSAVAERACAQVARNNAERFSDRRMAERYVEVYRR